MKNIQNLNVYKKGHIDFVARRLLPSKQYVLLQMCFRFFSENTASA